MTIQEAKETVVLAGRKLVSSGLIARTWGNISCRISNSHFVITPSGRDYLSLTPDEIVEVAIADLRYGGSIKPSSEKGVHADVYRLHPEACFVIHTHQDHASAVSVLGLDSINVSKDFPSLGGKVICAAYGLPGTKKLRGNVSKALEHSSGNAVIMKHHGALCFGANEQEAFQAAYELEEACRRFILDQYRTITQETDVSPLRVGCFALSRLTRKAVSTVENSNLPIEESERAEKGIRLRTCEEWIEVGSNQSSEYVVTKSKPIQNDKSGSIQNIPLSDTTQNRDFFKMAGIHQAIYNSHQEFNAVVHARTPGILAVSCTSLTLRPLLDDFAQIAGTSVKTAEMDQREVISALGTASVVLLRDNGALCCGKTRDDALAAAMVTEKNCNSLISAALLGKFQPISRLESRLMRLIYIKKYSKLASSK